MELNSMECTFRFEAAHRLLDTHGKCQYLHGHSYKASIVLTRDKVSPNGMVLDWSVVKGSVGNWIKENWDHNLILHPYDPVSILFEEMVNPPFIFGSNGGIWGEIKKMFGQYERKKPFLMTQLPFSIKEEPQPERLNPTAENLAFVLFHHAKHILNEFNSIRVVQTVIRESKNFCGVYCPDAL